MPKAKPRPHHHTHQPSLSPTQLPAHIQYQTQPTTTTFNPDLQSYYQTRTTASLNLSVLQRHNPRISQILSIAPFAVVYTFAQSSLPNKEPCWEKTGVEGTLFIVALDHQDGYEHYGVMVLNRKGLENFEMKLESAESVEVSGEFVILQDQQEQEEGEGVGITGLWIFANSGAEAPGGENVEKEGEGLRSLIAGVITECAARAETSRMKFEQTNSQQEVGHAGVSYDGAGDEATDGGAVLQNLFARARTGQLGYG